MMGALFVSWVLLHLVVIYALARLESAEGEIKLNYKGWLIVTLLAPLLVLIMGLASVLVKLGERLGVFLFRLLSRFQK